MKNENKKIQGAYEKKKNQRLSEFGGDQSLNVSRMTSNFMQSQVEVDSASILKPAVSKCCHLCNNIESIICWRNHLITYLECDAKHVVAIEEDEDVSITASSKKKTSSNALS